MTPGFRLFNARCDMLQCCWDHAAAPACCCAPAAAAPAALTDNAAATWRLFVPAAAAAGLWNVVAARSLVGTGLDCRKPPRCHPYTFGLDHPIYAWWQSLEQWVEGRSLRFPWYCSLVVGQAIPAGQEQQQHRRPFDSSRPGSIENDCTLLVWPRGRAARQQQDIALIPWQALLTAVTLPAAITAPSTSLDTC